MKSSLNLPLHLVAGRSLDFSQFFRFGPRVLSRFLFLKPRQLETATVGLPSRLPNLIGFLITVVRPVVVPFGFPLLGHSWRCKENVNIEPTDFLEVRSLGRFNLNKLRSEQGQGVGEYAIMLAVILVVLMGAIHLIGANANNIFSQVGSAIQ
jgi:pilus assembly protein Flp/PilA